MDRRRFLSAASTAAATTAASAALAACGPGPGHDRRRTGASREPGGPAIVTAPRVRWRLASSFPRSTDILYRAAERLAARVAALTDGRFEITPAEGGVLVPPLQVLDAVQSGSVPMGHTAGYYFLGKSPVLAFSTAIPFGMQARPFNAWVRYGGGMDLLRRAYAAFGVVNFLGGNTGTQMGGWFRRPVTSLADLQGLTMRIPGIGGEVMQRLGVVPQTIPGGEIYTSLERGAIDAAEWVGPHDDETMGLYRVVQTYHYPGWWEPSAGLTFLVNQVAHDALPETYRQALATAADEADAHMLSEYDAKNPVALAKLIDAGVQVLPFPDDVMRAAERASRELIDANAQAHGGLYAETLQSYRAFQTSSARWFGTAEKAMARFAAG